MLQIDYNFRVGERHLCVTGWAGGAAVADAVLRGAGPDADARALLSHRRADLELPAIGFLAVFDIAQSPGQDAEWRFALAGEECRLRPLDLEEDFHLMVEQAPDAVFTDFLYAVAAGHLPPLGYDALATIRYRLGTLRAGYVEGPETAASVDVAMLTASGKGLARGWNMSQRDAPEAPVALVVGPDFARPFEILPNAMPRPDIAMQYGGRYRVTGMEGFCGTFELGGAAEGPVDVFVIARDPAGSSVAGRTAELCGTSAYARTAVVFKSEMPEPERLRLVEHALPFRAPGPGAAPKPQTGARIRLILDHDAADASLRDALRMITGWIPGAVSIRVVRDHPTKHMTEAVAGAIREAGEDWRGRIEIVPRLDISAAGAGVDIVVLARSSALFLFDALPAPAAELAGQGPGAVVHLYDPALNLSPELADRARLTRSFIEFSPPFLAAIAAGALPASFANLTARFLTVEGQMRAVIWALAGGIDYRLIRSSTGFEGARAPVSEFMVDTADVESYDATVLAELAAAHSAP